MLPVGVGWSGGGRARSRRVVLILCDLGMPVSDPALNHSTSRDTSQGRKTEQKEVREKQVSRCWNFSVEPVVPSIGSWLHAVCCIIRAGRRTGIRM